MPSNAEKAAKGQADLRRLIELGELRPGPEGLQAHLQGDGAFWVPFGLQSDGRLTYNGTAYDAPSAALKAALQAHGAAPAGYTGIADNPSHNGWLWIVRSGDGAKLEKLCELVKEEEEEEEEAEEDEQAEEEEQAEADPPALIDAGCRSARNRVRRRVSCARSEGQHAGADAGEAPEPPAKRGPGKEPVGAVPRAQACAALQAELQAPARATLAVFERDAARLERLQQQHGELLRERQGLEAQLQQARVNRADVAAAERELQAATAARNQLQSQVQDAANECRQLLAVSPVGAAAGNPQPSVAQLQELAREVQAARQQAAQERDAAVQKRQQLQEELERLRGHMARFAELAQQALPFVNGLQALQQQMQQQMQQQADGAGPAHRQ